MAYQYGFHDNGVYGAEDLNAAVSRMVTSGVADPFTDGVPYNASKVNDLVKPVYTSGVVPASVGTLKVTVTGTGTLSIATGLAFFSDGSTLEVTETEELNFTPGVKQYVYLKNDLTAQNRSYPVCTQAEPQGDFVLLAEIDEDGNAADKRTYARGRVPGYMSYASYPLLVSCDIEVTYPGTGSFGTGTGSTTLSLGETNYTYVFYNQTYPPGSSDSYTGFYNTETGQYQSHKVYTGSGTHHSDERLVYDNCIIAQDSSGWRDYYVELTFVKTGGSLTVNCKRHTARVPASRKTQEHFEFWLF